MNRSQVAAAKARIDELAGLCEEGERQLLARRTEIGLLSIRVRDSLGPRAARMFESECSLAERSFKRYRRFARNAILRLGELDDVRELAESYSSLHASCRAAEQAIRADEDESTETGEVFHVEQAAGEPDPGSAGGLTPFRGSPAAEQVFDEGGAALVPLRPGRGRDVPGQLTLAPHWRELEAKAADARRSAGELVSGLESVPSDELDEVSIELIQILHRLDELVGVACGGQG